MSFKERIAKLRKIKLTKLRTMKQDLIVRNRKARGLERLQNDVLISDITMVIVGKNSQNKASLLTSKQDEQLTNRLG